MPRSSGSAPPHRHTAGPLRTREDLATLRPGLVARYDAELPAARAAILARLLGALDREPLPGLTTRQPGEATFTRRPPAPAEQSSVSSTEQPGETSGGQHSTAHEKTLQAVGLGRDQHHHGREEPAVTAGAAGPKPGTLARAVRPVPTRDDPTRSAQNDPAGPAQNDPTRPGRDDPTGSASDGSGRSVTDVASAARVGALAGRAVLAESSQGGTDGGITRPDAEFAGVAREVTVRYPIEAAQPFAVVAAGLAARVSTGDPDRDGAGETSVVDPGELVRLLWGDVPLAGEIDNSVANLALARADRPEQQLPQPGDPDALGLVEQLVTDGHPLHPCCRTRGGMTVADVLAYAPEHSPVIRLRRLKVPRDRWYGNAPPILYAHPWQADRLVARYPWLTADGETEPVRPLMSLRTVAPVDGGPHIKTAVDVQMTSAVRTVSPAAVHNGPVLSKLLRRLTADQPIQILAEIAAGAVVVDGVPQRHLAHVVREAPQLEPGELAVPLAAFGASPLLLATVPDPYEWMGLLAEVFFAPITRVLARGVALEAHGQNSLVVLEDGRPTRVLYRDLGGVRVSASRLRAIGIDPPALHGDLPSDDPAELRTKLAAAAFGTVAAELIAALDADAGRLWGIVARAVRATGTEDVPHLLRDPLPIKATTAMRLAADPLDDRWALVPNPMAAHS